MSHRKVLHPTTQYRVDQLHHSIDRLRLVASEHVFEFPQQRRALLELGRVVRSPNTPKTANAAKLESQEAEALALAQVYDAALLFIDLDLQFRELLP